MKTNPFIILLLPGIFACTVSLAQIKPDEAVALMLRGINIGNTMEPENEGGWNNPKIAETLFDDYQAAGFTSIRIPIRWDKHTLTVSPFTIDSAWMNRVEQVVDWGLNRGLFITINSHHDDWIKKGYSDPVLRARFDSIWSQVAVRFQGKSDRLLFEMINEPKGLTQVQINDLNARILQIIRKTNPTRLVIYSGHEWSAAEQLISAAVPDPADEYLIGYFHSYDPWPFGLEGTGSYGSSADIAATKARFDKVVAWSVSKNIPVILSEFGAIRKCAYNSRMYCYASVVEQSINHGVAFNAWDDGGDFQMLIRSQRKWNDIKDIVMYTYKESPTKLKLTLKNDTNIVFSWTNRTLLNDSIIVERKTLSTGTFSKLATLAPDAASFYDSLLIPNKEYYYRLVTNIKDSILLCSYPIMIKTTQPVYIDPNTNILKNQTGINIYPNPANSWISIINSGSRSDLSLEIFDALGQLKNSQPLDNKETRIPLTGFERGIYFFKIYDTNSTEVSRIIVQ
jgi:aryl-phospho-beta-D-glucosidase BglC (GH1 family)